MGKVGEVAHVKLASRTQSQSQFEKYVVVF